MPTTAAGICNIALGRLGIRIYIDDLVTSDLEEAETCNVYYEAVRDSMLASFPWPWATLREPLVQIDTSVEPTRDGWGFVYALPDKCLVPRFVWPTGQTTLFQDLFGRAPSAALFRMLSAEQRFPFMIEKGTANDKSVLLSDLDSPILFYTAKMTDPTAFDPLFVDALTWQLASEMAMPLTASLNKKQDCSKEARTALTEAMSAALAAEQPDDLPDSEFIRGRR
jgi:hypothetical protein